eukprot:superscaffoldBa00000087_g1299
MSNPTHDPFYSSPFGPFYRRHSPYMVQPEYRIYEMNKRLQTRTEVSRPEITAARSRLGRGTGRRVAGCGSPVPGGGRGVWRLDREARVGMKVRQSGDMDVMPKCQTFLR